MAVEKALLAAMRAFRRTNSELRAIYLPTSHPNKMQAADAQLKAHEAIDDLHEEIARYVRYAWALTPSSERPDHLASIDTVRAEQQVRLAAARVDLRKELEARLKTDDGQVVTIILKDQDRTRHHKAE